MALSFSREGRSSACCYFWDWGVFREKGGSRRKEAEKGGQISESLEEPERGEIFWLEGCWRGRWELQERCSELEERSLVGGRITWSPVGLCWRKTPSGMITTGILMFLAVYLSSISLFDVWIFVVLFGVDIGGHRLVCWEIILHLCMSLLILTCFAPIVIMECSRIMHVVVFNVIYSPERKIHWWPQEVNFLKLSVFIHFPPCSVSPPSSAF